MHRLVFAAPVSLFSQPLHSGQQGSLPRVLKAAIRLVNIASIFVFDLTPDELDACGTIAQCNPKFRQISTSLATPKRTCFVSANTLELNKSTLIYESMRLRYLRIDCRYREVKNHVRAIPRTQFPHLAYHPSTLDIPLNHEVRILSCSRVQSRTLDNPYRYCLNYRLRTNTVNMIFITFNTLSVCLG